MPNEASEMVVQDKYGAITYNQSVFSAIARNVIEESDKIEVAESSKLSKPSMSVSSKMENCTCVCRSE